MVTESPASSCAARVQVVDAGVGEEVGRCQFRGAGDDGEDRHRSRPSQSSARSGRDRRRRSGSPRSTGRNRTGADVDDERCRQQDVLVFVEAVEVRTLKRVVAYAVRWAERISERYRQLDKGPPAAWAVPPVTSPPVIVAVAGPLSTHNAAIARLSLRMTASPRSLLTILDGGIIASRRRGDRRRVLIRRRTVRRWWPAASARPPGGSEGRGTSCGHAQTPGDGFDARRPVPERTFAAGHSGRATAGPIGSEAPVGRPTRRTGTSPKQRSGRPRAAVHCCPGRSHRRTGIGTGNGPSVVRFCFRPLSRSLAIERATAAWQP